jgi:hypothetical protein
MMVWVANGVPRPAGLAMSRAACREVPSCRVIAPANHVCEWSAAQHHTVAWHYSGMPAPFVNHDDTTCPHVLQVPR